MNRKAMESIRAMDEKTLAERIQQMRNELTKLRISQAKGTLRKEHGKIRPMRRDIARMLTCQSELKKK